MADVNQTTAAPAQSATTTQAPSSSGTNWNEISAIASLVLGIINLCSWILPLCGCPMAIIGIVTGILGLKTEKKTLAIVGIVLSGLALIATIINSILGVAMNSSNYSYDFNY
ncbi:DUF4190 domain-containing protein [Candidatus Dojkabacteria bacterium]|nr:DUF4190 domain-containing protein [Candidatus Dojkabacteria bacterium]